MPTKRSANSPMAPSSAAASTKKLLTWLPHEKQDDRSAREQRAPFRAPSLLMSLQDFAKLRKQPRYRERDYFSYKGISCWKASGFHSLGLNKSLGRFTVWVHPSRSCSNRLTMKFVLGERGREPLRLMLPVWRKLLIEPATKPRPNPPHATAYSVFEQLNIPTLPIKNTAIQQFIFKINTFELK